MKVTVKAARERYAVTERIEQHDKARRIESKTVKTIPDFLGHFQ